MKRMLLVVVLLTHPCFAQHDCQTGYTFSSPIVIGKGGTYTGNWRSTTESVPAVTITTTDPVTIVNSRLAGPGDLLTQMWNGRVTIQNDCFVGTNPNIRGTAKGSPIRIQNPTDLVVEHSDFVSTGGNGISVTEYWGDFTAADTIKVRYNRFFDVDGRYSDGAGGYLANENGFPSHAVILSLVKGVPGIEIAWNQVINTPGSSQDTDSINLFSSSGTKASHLSVHDNYVQGQYAANPTNPDGLNYNGTAIVTDDLPGITDPAAATRFVDISSNQVVSIALAGISISAGNNNAMYDNRVVSSGRLSDGRVISSINAAGVGTNNYLNEPAGVYGNNSAVGNVSGTFRPSASLKRQDFYFGVAPYYAASNTSFLPVSDTRPTTADEASELAAWQLKLSSQRITVGSTLLH
jgi:hypothetical protein